MLATVGILAGLPAAPAAAEPPVADFESSPGTPLTLEQVTFTSTSSDPDGDQITETAWDFDEDLDFEVVGTSATQTYSRPREYSVRLRVVAGGEPAVQERMIVVVNRAPQVSIAAIPSNPIAGQPITFVSLSSDLDGAIGGQVWDVDDDGFNDGSDMFLTKTFVEPGMHTVRVAVSDREEPPATTIASVRVIVAAGPPGGQIIGGSTLQLMTPFPIVRMAGLVRRGGIRLRLLSVNAPFGATIRFRCRGRGCPFRRRSRVVERTKGTKKTASAGTVRFRQFGPRLLRAGAVISVRVTKPGSIGKYTRFKIRRGRVPARRDRCLTSATAPPIRCPST